ncbi:metal-dependent hydrolase (plasmid) [Methylomarinum sp. Ch1-1]|uniref:Metal-dependent hydrolase n=1 Tax=Methylomarinum roseum TaxID=3067653 RepID=A0AAU7P0S9_9GAMM|nr:metal-dependent hydrolase [Methylomarinum sp. Ch1-1]MDP4523215.1 metal-dependent hydrolase [Methylomarinum sp. Ch1-1]
MTKNGHFITNSCFAALTYWSNENGWFALGVIAGALAPDYLEITFRNPFSKNGYSRTIPHRTITHWWPLWLILWYYAPPLEQWVAYVFLASFGVSLYIGQLIAGYAVGGIIHLICDAFSPSGIPTYLPFSATRIGAGLYTTGKNEWRIVMPMAILSGLFLYSQNTFVISQFLPSRWVQTILQLIT